jgi:hypothetical protein
MGRQPIAEYLFSLCNREEPDIVLVAENGAISVDPCPTQNKINRNVMSVLEQNAAHAAILNKILDGGIRQRYVLTVAIEVPSLVLFRNHTCGK